MTKAIEAGLPKLRIEEAAARKQARIDSGKDKIIGVNIYQVDDKTEMDILDVDNNAVRESQVARLQTLRNERDEFMRWADHRLLRRMIRDSWSRNHDAMSTLTHWHYVRKSELQYIIPFIGNVDFVVNSAMPFEFPVLKNRLFHFFPEAIERYRKDFKRQDAYLRAQRVMQFLEPLRTDVEESCIPSSSLFREFIGGSKYTY